MTATVIRSLLRRAARTWAVPVELARLLVASWQYGREETRERATRLVRDGDGPPVVDRPAGVPS